MKTIDAVIIEDEVPAARLLLSMVTALRPQWNVGIVPGNIEDAVAWFNAHDHPDLIFLDIHLSDGDAFEFLSTAKPRSSIIFTTAYDEYALRAFSFDSIAYLLKPVDENHLAAAIGKFERMSESGGAGDTSLDVILDALKNPTRRYRTRFTISYGTEMKILQVDSVSYFHTEDKVTYAVTADGKEYAVDVTISRLEEQLNPEQFFRVNRQFILNVDCIEKAVPFQSGRILVNVKPSFRTEIVVSEGRAPAFRMWLNY